MGAWWVSCRKAHDGSITDKWCEVKAKRFLLIASGLGNNSARVEYDHQKEDAPSHVPEMGQDALNSFRLLRGVIHAVVLFLDLTPTHRFVDEKPPLRS